MYSVSADTNDVGIVDVPLTPDFHLQTDKIISTSTSDSNIKLMFLCSPGNPTCVTLKVADIVKVLESDFNGFVVVDEAYVDFAGKEASVSQLVAKYPQLVVMQTMSKAFGLAGIRCGFAIANKDTIEIMNKVKAPYNVNKLTSKVALDAYDNLATFNDHMEKVLAERTRLKAALLAMKDVVQEVKHSDTNFLMFRLDNAQKVYKQMADGGVVVRYRGNCLHCDGCLRVTIGTPEENDRFLALLQKTAAAVA
jgi:histidinol-phosphate aminotransferase